jgi:hypothetical protein
MADESNQKSPKDQPQGLSTSTLGLLIVAVLLVRVVVWMQSDLWYDEVVTLVEFSLGGAKGTLSHVFRHYPIANNHILFSAILWVWVRLVGMSMVEPILRLPSLAFSLLTVLGVFWLWTRSLGRRVALFAALTLAVSPALSPFYYQLRGYSLSFLLAVLAVSGTFELVQGNLRKGAWQAVVPCLLLPLVIPSNVLLVAALAAFVLVAGKGDWRQRLGGALVLGVPGLIGGSYYLTIWDQFVKVMDRTAGWQSGWLVAGNLLLALLAHLGPAAIVVLCCLFARSRLVGQARQERREALLLAGICALVVAAGIIAAKTAPFPRVFAVFFVPLTWAAFRVCRQSSFWQARGMVLVVGTILISGFAWEKGSAWLTHRELAKGEHPQNLLQQYYLGDSELSSLVTTMKKLRLDQNVVVLTDPYDFRTLDFYWWSRGLPTVNDGSVPGMGMPRVIASNGKDRELLCQEAVRRGYCLAAVARNEEDAARIFGACGQLGRFEKVVEMGSRSLYMLVPGSANTSARPGMPGRS